MEAWKKANPQLAMDVSQACQSLADIQASFLEQMTEEITENSEQLCDGSFVTDEFVDRFGPRLAHLMNMQQVFGVLGS